MPREAMKDDYTQEEINNLESGKCWCGKPRTEFDKLMRVYCSKKHRTDWYNRTITWSVFKNEVLDEKGKICAVCGCTPDSLKKKGKQSFLDWMQLIKNNKKAMEIIEKERIKQLNDLEEKYQKIMSDDYLIKYELSHRYSDLPDGLPSAPDDDHWTGDRFEVDHIKAVSLGGDMWDKNNLQILCSTDHKKKTAEDMKKLKAKRRNLKRFDDE